MMYCSKCGCEIPNGATFCPRCGARVEPPQQNSWQQNPYGNGQGFAQPMQPMPPMPPPPPSPEVSAAESKSIASLIMGILGIVFCWIGLGVILGPLAIYNGKAARQVLSDKSHNYYIGLAGIITGSIGLGLSIFFVIYWITIWSIIRSAGLIS